MKFTSYIKKGFLLFRLKTTLRNKLIQPNLYSFNFDGQQKIHKVLFDFSDPQYMHLGDHLFFIPVIQQFLKNKYHVTVSVTHPMRELFSKLAIPLIESFKIDYHDYDLIIGRIEQVNQFENYPSILVHVSNNLTMPICSQLMREFECVFGFSHVDMINFTQFCDDSILHKLKLPEDRKIILFNPYCDASSYLITRAKREFINNKVIELQSKLATIIVITGTAREKSNDVESYPFNYFDIRGQTSVMDLFMLVNHPNVVSYVGFDAFLMHVFSLCNKTSYALFRGRITRKQNDMLKKYHMNLFINDRFVHTIDE